MPYDKIPGVSAVLRDGGLLLPRNTAQPRIIILGSAKKGDSYRMFTVVELTEAEKEFGKNSEIIKKAHEVFAEGGDNIALMRIGGKKGSIVIDDPSGSGATLTIIPEMRDDEVLDRYSLVIRENDDGDLQILIWDLENGNWAYDSDEVLVSDNSNFEIEVSGTWDSGSTIGSYTFPGVSTATPALSAVNGWFFPAGAWSAITVAGTDGENASYVEKYASLEEAYQMLDYRDGDMVIPCGVYLDVPNVAMRTDGSHYESGTGSAVYTPDFDLGVPVAGDADNDVLGWLWQYLNRGKVYTYFCDGDIFAQNATLTVTSVGELVFTAVADGFAGEAVTVQFTAGAFPGAEVVSVVGNAITVQISSGVSTAAQIKAAIDATPLALAKVSVAIATAGTMVTTSVASLALGGYLTHEDLTGEVVPAAVQAKFVNGDSSQLREANFAHQLASFCHTSSTVWKDMLGFISVLPPEKVSGFSSTRVSRDAIREWAGDAPTYSNFGSKKGIDSASDNGEGVLGNKFLAGASGYRYAGLDGYGDPQDGLAYGGLVLTKGKTLPNEGGWVYGISTTDEALDGGGSPIDIGRHIFITYDYPVHNNAFKGGSTYRGTLEGILAAKLARMAENQEPIGPVNGVLVSVSSPLKMTAALTNQFAEIRATGMMTDERSGSLRNTLVACRTAAHPDSDYTRVSTIRCVNREIRGIRNIAMPYIGQSFSSTTLVSLQQAIDGFLKAERSLGFNQGAVAALSYSREDRVMGRLTVTLRMIPPFSIEQITIQVSLAAEEAEL
jgi:hypothetical protein